MISALTGLSAWRSIERHAISALLWSALACTLVHAQGFPPERRPSGPAAQFRNSIALDAGVLAGGLSYARQLNDRLAAGVGIGAGAQLGLMVFNDRFSTGAYGVDRLFAELLHGDLFLRSSPVRPLQLEGGVRAAWLYHWPTEYETVFLGVQVAALFRVGRFRLGPRLILGRMSEEAGLTAGNLGLIPVLIRYEWGW